MSNLKKPNAVIDYIKHMGGVEHRDYLISCYSTWDGPKSSRYQNFFVSFILEVPYALLMHSFFIKLSEKQIIDQLLHKNYWCSLQEFGQRLNMYTKNGVLERKAYYVCNGPNFEGNNSELGLQVAWTFKLWPSLMVQYAWVCLVIQKLQLSCLACLLRVCWPCCYSYAGRSIVTHAFPQGT